MQLSVGSRNVAEEHMCRVMRLIASVCSRVIMLQVIESFVSICLMDQGLC